MTTSVPTDDQVRRQELTAFLRSRRERLSPEQAGLPPTGRRRTPGLRREEVAYLAGMGVTWYTWLEQGRDITVSDQVLAAIATTLRLDPYERVHLYELAGHPAPPMSRDGKAIPDAVLVMVRHLEPIPAAVINARFDLLAYNHAYEHLVGGLDDVPFEDRNLLLLMFTSARWRARVLDWEDAATRLAGRFRAGMASHAADSSRKTLVKRLRQDSPDFVRLWEQHDVRAPENFTKRYLHPEVGLLTLDYTQLWLGERSELKLTTYTPADDETWAKVRLLRESGS
ncbi:MULTISPECIES: helix-turn-helix transcriptional regulator [unclassified Amycolatopsis]|uniref:helix-turn-helix transcriptional regulator n=1 Tax=unclassified Amycolatopsis TaxID=2618356 RepID=UPI002E15FF7C|nr:MULTISPECIES: helix-turn-helix transcriptional regulator [unclassified Amycolatopsis]WSK77081.1 helix-turn-helix transcriptional regulator [Amycolatopsis sp. NBC_01286]